MKFTLVSITFTVLLWFTAPLVQAQSKDEQTVLDAEKARFEATTSKNYDAMERLLADDLVYTHSSGVVDGKQAYIESIRSGKANYVAIIPDEQKVRVYGNTAIVNGTCQVKMNNDNKPTEFKLRYTDVYVKKGKQWQLAAWQSLKIQ